MTLRKFFRFFKHFGYYMRKDWNWLVRRHQNKKACREAKKQDARLEKFKAALNKVAEKMHQDKYVFCRNSYYIIDSRAPWTWTKIWRNAGTWFIQYGKKTRTFEIGEFEIDEQNIGTNTLKSIFTESTNPADSFTVLIGDLTNVKFVETVTGEGNERTFWYKVYHLYGKQRPRLEYTISWKYGCSSQVTLYTSRSKEQVIYDLPYKGSRLIKKFTD